MVHIEILFKLKNKMLKKLYFDIHFDMVTKSYKKKIT